MIDVSKLTKEQVRGLLFKEIISNDGLEEMITGTDSAIDKNDDFEFVGIITESSEGTVIDISKLDATTNISELLG
jgi:hypothetical protein